jgi:hypothetical protein
MIPPPDGRGAQEHTLHDDEAPGAGANPIHDPTTIGDDPETKPELASLAIGPSNKDGSEEAKGHARPLAER